MNMEYPVTMATRSGGVFKRWFKHSGLRVVLFLIAGIVLGGSLCSCLEFHQEITLESETRGTFEIQAQLPENVAVVAEKQAGFSQYFDPVKGAAYFNGKGVKIRKYRVYKQWGGKRVIKINGEIVDFNKVMSSGCLGDITRTKHDGKTRLSFKITPGTGKSEEPLEQAFKGVTLSLEVETPEKIVATSGKKSGASTAKWAFDADEDSSFLKKAPDIYIEYH